MLFLVRRKVKNPKAIPEDRLAVLRVQTIMYAIKLLRAGKIVVSGGFPNGSLAHIVFNATSAAELKSLLEGRH